MNTKLLSARDIHINYGLLIDRLNLCRRKQTELVFRETLGREYNCVGNIYIILYLVSLLRTSCGSNPHSRYSGTSDGI